MSFSLTDDEPSLGLLANLPQRAWNYKSQLSAFQTLFFFLFSHLKYDVNKWGCLFIKALQKRNIWKKEAGREEEGDIPVKLPGICSLLLGMSA